MHVSGTIIIAILVLTLFLTYITGLKYAVTDTFTRTRLNMTSFFLFIVATLTISFWPYALASVPYTAPAALLGVIIGYVVGVREAERKLMMLGLNNYLEHFAHIHIKDLKELRWWSIVNFYSVMGALLLINLVGFSNVILKGKESWVITTCAVGAFLLGTIVPYLLHLWSIKYRQKKRSATSDA